MSNCFHLAVEGGKLELTLPFYTTILGCELGPSEEGKWQDIDFWGNELTLHESEPYIRFEGKDTQQETFFVEDPNFNMLEIKSIQGTYYE